ncbi:winged helix-turn-helix domain-containing protein [Dongia sp.]|uniref:ATP-binding protein n=1 Tax=Dongia sp. TaxID=1977262 RepID=UPI0035B08ABA
MSGKEASQPDAREAGSAQRSSDRAALALQAPAPPPPDAIAFGPYRLLIGEKALLLDGKPLHLGSRALDILIALAERRGTVVSHAELMQRVWPSTHVTENTLRVHITALRKALGERAAGRRYILSSSGRGYMLVASASPSGRQPHISGPNASLPQPPSRLFGREELVAGVMSRISQHRLVTLVGPGGIGKTSIAVTAAHRIAPQFADGCIFLDLSPILHGHRVAVSLATALGVDTYAGDPVQTIAQHIGSRHQLIVLDTCEHILDSVARLAAKLLAATPHLRILATSREKLWIHEEWVCAVPGLALPHPGEMLTAKHAASYPAIELFAYRSQAAGADFALTEGTAPAVTEICRKLDGLPLAIELAAARIDDLGPQELLNQLGDRFHVLVDGYRDALPRHQTLRATIAWSHDLLSSAEQALFRRLGVFRQAMNADAAASVTAGDIVSAALVSSMLQNLAAKSLLVRSENADEPRFRLLDSSAAFALEALRERGEQDETARRHAHYFRDLLEEMWPNEIPPDLDREMMRSMAEEVQAAASWAESAGDSRLFAELVAAAVPLWLHLSLTEYCRAQAELALQWLPDAPEFRHLQMKLNAAIGGAHLSVDGAGARVRAAWSQTLDIARALDDAEYQLRALWGLWADLRNRGLYLEAFKMAQQFHEISRNTRDTGLDAYRGTGERLLGVSRFIMGEFEAGKRNLDCALDMLSSGTPPSIVAMQFDQVMLTRCNIAFMHWIQGRQTLALAHTEDIVRQAIDRGHVISLCYALSDCACPLSYLGGEYDLAERYTAMLMLHSEGPHAKIWNMVGRCFEGMIAMRRGRVATGIARLEETLDGLGHIGAGPIYAQYARALMAAGREGEAMAVIEREIANCVSGERWFLAEYHRIKGEIAVQAGAESEARESFVAALDLARAQQAFGWELRAATSLAELLNRQGRQAEARRILVPALDRYPDDEQTRDILAARAALQFTS